MRWRHKPPAPALRNPWRTPWSPPSIAPPPDDRARVALLTAGVGWALVFVGALAPGLAGVEGADGVAGLVAFGVWRSDRRPALNGASREPVSGTP